MALNDNIRKLREENNLTQQQSADRLYVSRQTVCRWCTIAGLCIAGAAFVINYIISKKLDHL